MQAIKKDDGEENLFTADKPLFCEKNSFLHLRLLFLATGSNLYRLLKETFHTYVHEVCVHL
jgi:hypothetical protein